MITNYTVTTLDANTDRERERYTSNDGSRWADVYYENLPASGGWLTVTYHQREDGGVLEDGRPAADEDAAREIAIRFVEE